MAGWTETTTTWNRNLIHFDYVGGLEGELRSHSAPTTDEH